MCRVGIFEIIMLLCFSAAWPFSIAKSFRARSTKGKSLLFLIVVLIGYAAGVIHKTNCDNDPVVGLYIFNGFLVLTDLVLYLRNHMLENAVPAGVSDIRGNANQKGEP
jgi:lipopolysaccharide export LptBFGC system permease protein LptF